MSGPTNRRFVRSAWTLLAFQFVAAAGALTLAIWAATRVQALIDQRDLLQARVTRLETEQERRQVAPIDDTPQAQLAPAEPAPVAIAPEPVPKASAQPARPLPHPGGAGVVVHTPPPAVVIETPPPPREPDVTYVPPREPPVRYPPREPPLRTPREPPLTYVPRRPPVIVRPNFPTRPAPTPQQPGTILRPIRPNNGAPNVQQPVSGVARPSRPTGVTVIRPTVTRPQAGTTATRPVDPRRIRRPRPVDTTDTQQNPPK